MRLVCLSLSAMVCNDCETLIQAPVPVPIIDEGIPTAVLLADVMIAKFADHLLFYRVLPSPCSTLAQ